jgi:hypothetical protein
VISGKRSLKDVECNFNLHLLLRFTGWRAANITTADIRQYITERQDEDAANAIIKRELSNLRRAFSFVMDGGKITIRPNVPRLTEVPRRPAFFEPEMVPVAGPGQAGGYVHVCDGLALLRSSVASVAAGRLQDRDGEARRWHHKE